MRLFRLLALAVVGTVLAQDTFDDRQVDSDDSFDVTRGSDRHNKTRTGPHPNASSEPTILKCIEIRELTRLINIANNATRLNRTTHGDATKAAAIKAEASKAAPTLNDLKGNSTLVASCQQFFAHEDMVERCVRMHYYERLEKLAANATLLDHKFHGDAARISAVKAEATADASKLSRLSSNATLTQFCAARRDHARCLELEKLQKEVDKAQNATSTRGGAGADKTHKGQAEASSAAARLDALKSNTTLVNYCNSHRE
ncbi:uncharacterized protein E0L32_001611 [Thyridium curvatum]|uniref:Uncharacterized protein n=1 Tax=Thyridium curvatum TaxID=1093900 RepID=A0A507AR10_9PEZI|nr:uncharacterized protein E0L32_001586 [Thyridium curvatum]XP_030990862.1 uncharacterized protein E0L32_001611 [Thyridium curvatum]TPX09126.1 hypothetical protein E0L32_001586 [Thyridium curvatum]TPX09151.1 hypothetical protein E0L32_001611 [Thyridium curvatum]